MELRITLIKSGWPLLILAMLFSVVGGCVSQQARLLKKKQQDILKSYRQHVAMTIDDPARAEQLIGIGEDLYKKIQADTKVLLQMAEKIKKLNTDYGTTREELENDLSHINSQRAKMRDSIMLARSEALSLTTPVEWQELMNRRGTLLELIQETPGFL